MPNIERFTNPHRSSLLKPPVMCCERVYNRASNSLFVLLSPLLPSFSPFPFLLDPEFFSYPSKLLESLLLSLSERLCFLQRAGNVAAPPWLIRGAEPCWAAAISKSLLQWKWVFLSYWSPPESLPHRVRKDDVAYWCGPWSSSGHIHCRVIRQIRKGTAKYEMMALGHDSCW